MKKTRGPMVWLLLLPLLLLNACTGETIEGYTLSDDSYYVDNAPAAVAIILGNHANAMAVPEDAYDYIEEQLDHVVYGGYACAIVSDATPTKVDVVDEDFFKQDARNPEILRKHISERKEQLIEALKDEDLIADSPEVDLLAAIREAKSALSASRVNGIEDKRIIIIDTGISTSGDLNLLDMDFTNGWPEASSLVKQLSSYEGVGVLPDLTGISVTFLGTADGLAETGGPQKTSTTDKTNLKELWTSIVQACGAKEINYEAAAGWSTPNVYTEDETSKFSYVSVISFSHKPIVDLSDLQPIDTNDPDAQPTMPGPPIAVKLESESIGFKPDSAELLNDKSAANLLKPYAKDLEDYLSCFQDEKFWIVGTTATTQKGGEGSVTLSLQRADEVKRLLMDLGIPEGKLVTIGLGARFPWHVDEYPQGSFDTKEAQANRAVWLLNSSPDNEEFKLLQAAYEEGMLLPETAERFGELISGVS